MAKELGPQKEDGRVTGEETLMCTAPFLPSCFGWGCIDLKKPKWVVIDWPETVAIPKH